MKFGYTIIYVNSVLETLEFYERAFDQTRRFVHESNLYAELETGSTVLGFAAESVAEMNDLSITPNRPGQPAAGIEVCFVTETIDAAYAKAVAEGACAVLPPTVKPWGQTIAYVRDLNGCLVELATPIHKP